MRREGVGDVQMGRRGSRPEFEAPRSVHLGQRARQAFGITGEQYGVGVGQEFALPQYRQAEEVPKSGGNEQHVERH